MVSGFWGGAAQGIGQGIKLVDDYRTGQRKKELLQNQRDADALGDVLVNGPQEGDMVDTATTPETVVKAAIDKVTPKPGPLTRMVQTAARGLKIDDAAQASGVLPPPPAAPAPGVGAQTASLGGVPGATPAAGTGIPGAPAPDPNAVGEITVTPQKARLWTGADAARVRLAQAMKSGDQNAIQGAWTAYQTAATDDTVDHITNAARRGWDGLANYANSSSHDDHTFDYEPDPNDPTKADVIYNGQKLGKMSLEQARDSLIGEVKHDPHYGLQAQLQQREADRLDAHEQSQTSYQTSALALRQRELAAEADYRAASADYMRTQSAAAKATMEQAQHDREFDNNFQASLYDGNGAGDAMLNANGLTSMVQAAAADKAKLIPVKNADGDTVLVNPYEQIATQAIQAATRRFQSSPYTQVGVGKPGDPKAPGAIIQVKAVTLKDGTQRQFYTVAGDPNGLYTNFDAAENTARKLYPKAPNAKSLQGK